MIANYHTHTYRCGHAVGTEREYVEAAIENGFQILGFSDHTPYPFPSDHSHHIRMSMNELDGYVDTILTLKKEYEKDITIYLGLEVEYYPDYFDSLRVALSAYPIDYMLLAQHHLGNSAPQDAYSGSKTNDANRLIQYCNQITAAIEKNCFTYLAHPDLIYYTGPSEIYDKYMRQLCYQAKENNLPLEFNFTGLDDLRHYPNEVFWKIVGEVGNDVIFGLDAHHPGMFRKPDYFSYAQDVANRYHLNVLDKVNLVKPFSI